ncbi:MAG: reactive intermediate/imine deaminase [Bdellovibrionaceae bacterium]|nr:reactive intermediate/imine deaminase [Pseudobdellovibrionaceae bacterium]|tara:strand:+ start:673 stop:1053 length:381 start_codon:yes stop_codon:yes gene_type:complete
MKKAFNSDHAPKPVGPYSHAVEVDGLVYLSGQVPIDPKTNEVFTGDIQKQTEMVMSNIEAVLKEADLNFSHVIKSSIFLTDMKDFAQVNEIYAKAFQAPFPARSCVQVAALPKAVNVEIEVIARRS